MIEYVSPIRTVPLPKPGTIMGVVTPNARVIMAG
jgi:hypothetical protein